MPDSTPKAPEKPTEAIAPVIGRLRAWKPPAEAWSVVPETAAVVKSGQGKDEKTKLIIKAVRERAEKHPVQFTAHLAADSSIEQIHAALDESFGEYEFDHSAFVSGSKEHP